MRLEALTLAALLLASPAAAHALTPEQLAIGAQMIRAQGYPCERITSYARRGNAYRVRCGVHAYRVTLEPLTLRPW